MTEEIFEINCIGQKCPLPVLRLERALKRGKRNILLICDDPVSVIDIPLAAKKNHLILSSKTREDGIYLFEIRKESD